MSMCVECQLSPNNVELYFISSSETDNNIYRTLQLGVTPTVYWEHASELEACKPENPVAVQRFSYASEFPGGDGLHYM
jgi:hypothetical protein